MKEAGTSAAFKAQGEAATERALVQTLQSLVQLVNNLREMEVTSFRSLLDAYTVVEEDTGEEMEFVGTRGLLDTYQVEEGGTAERVLGEYVRVETVSGLLERLGWQEDQPESKKHLNYKVLNLQSKRIINRLNAYCEGKGVGVYELFRGIIKIQVVKTKSKQEDVELLKSDEFFKRLHQLQVVRSPHVKDNLCRFLCIDETYIGSLMFKKLLRACKDFKASQALTGIGIKKHPLPGA